MGCVWPCPGRMAASLSGLSLALCSSVPLATNLGKVWRLKGCYGYCSIHDKPTRHGN